jgi:hypothetical protein
MSYWTHNLFSFLIVGCVLGASSLASAAEYKGLSTSSPLFGEPSVGITSVVVKTVTGMIEDEVRQLAYKDDIYHNEIIETLEESATEITFLDETLISLGPNSKITLDRFIYDPNPDASTFVTTITQGALRFVSGKLPSKAYTIHTPTATIGIRGTIINVVVERTTGKTGIPVTRVDLTVLDGEAEFVTCDGVKHLVAKGLSRTIWDAAALGCAEATARDEESSKAFSDL